MYIVTGILRLCLVFDVHKHRVSFSDFITIGHICSFATATALCASLLNSSHLKIVQIHWFWTTKKINIAKEKNIPFEER